MIRISCTECDAVLEIDDAFAGGVCRCKHCGTIQTVPKDVKRPATPAAAGIKGAQGEEKPKALVHTKSPAKGEAALDELAEVVASSGLAGGQHLHRETSRISGPAVGRRNTVLMCVAGVILVLLGAVVTYMVMRERGGTGDGGGRTVLPETEKKGQGGTGTGAVVSPVTGPSFMGLALRGPSVVYVLDRGQGTIETFDWIKAATIDSARSLGAERMFAVVFWETDKIIAWPVEGLQAATEQNVKLCGAVLADVYCFGQSKVGPAIEKAVARNPAEIVLVTGKSGLDEQFVNAVMAARKSGTVKIHAVSVGESGSSEAMKAVAAKTGGEFRVVGTAELGR